MDRGSCESCGASFEYSLIHNGFNDSAYAYCDRCGGAALLSAWSDKAPAGVRLRVHGEIQPEIIGLLSGCTCGGRFAVGAVPRCPSCKGRLSPEDAGVWIERNAPGTEKGWRWQRKWDGLYCVIIEENVTHDPWKAPSE